VNSNDAEEFTQALGQIVAGSWRQIALADRLGVPAALGLSTREWVEQRLGGYLRLSIPERREAVAELVGDGMTQREAADVLGVGSGTVARDLAPNGAAAKRETSSDAHSDGDAAPDGAAKPTQSDPLAMARDITLSIADAVRYLDRPPEHADKVAAMFDPEGAGIGREDWTRARFERAGTFLAALVESLAKEDE
jgi:hypothetical protein